MFLTEVVVVVKLKHTYDGEVFGPDFLGRVFTERALEDFGPIFDVDEALFADSVAAGDTDPGANPLRVEVVQADFALEAAYHKWIIGFGQISAFK